MDVNGESWEQGTPGHHGIIRLDPNPHPGFVSQLVTCLVNSNRKCPAAGQNITVAILVEDILFGCDATQDFLASSLSFSLPPLVAALF